MRKIQRQLFKEAAEDFSPPASHTPDVMSSRNMLANVDLLTSALLKSLCFVALDAPPSHYAPFGTKIPAKFKKDFHEQIEWAKKIGQSSRQKCVP